MPKDKFELLRTKSKTTGDSDGKEEQSQADLIMQLRAKARGLREENNNLVQQLWDIDIELAQKIDDEKRHRLNAKKDVINQSISDKQLPEKIQELLEQIIRLETEFQGYSEVNSNSPYTL